MSKYEQEQAERFIESPSMKGWIAFFSPDRAEDARSQLESLGVKVGALNSERNEFQDCVVSDTAFARLAPLWGDFIWGLQ